jgi:hypothetical protein
MRAMPALTITITAGLAACAVNETASSRLSNPQSSREAPTSDPNNADNPQALTELPSIPTPTAKASRAPLKFGPAATHAHA